MTKKESLHPEIVFHFTKKRNALFGILNDRKFRLSYCKETIHRSGKLPLKPVCPMVSFCDIKLSDIKKHITSYGNYGIGLKKEWAMKKKLNPVIYVNGDSTFLDDFYDGMQNLNTNNGNLNTNSYNKILSSYRFMKNYEGPLQRNGKKLIPNYRFADEKEWRYVPPMGTLYLQNIFPVDFLDHPTYDNRKKDFDTFISSYTLDFTSDDIQYIIVDKEHQIQILINKLKKSFPINVVERLSSRILTKEQVFTDM